MEYITSARGQSQPVDIASFANKTRISFLRCTSSGSILGISYIPAFINSFSPKTCANDDFGSRKLTYSQICWQRVFNVFFSTLLGTCTTKSGITGLILLVAHHPAHKVVDSIKSLHAAFV